MKHYIKLFLAALILTNTACEKPLEEKVFSELAPGNFFRNEEDANTVLNAAYTISQGYPDLVRDYICFGEMSTDMLITRGGAISNFTFPVEEFSWDASHPWLSGLWSRYYSAIYRTNVLLDLVPGIQMNDDRKEQILAEARFLSALTFNCIICWAVAAASVHFLLFR